MPGRFLSFEKVLKPNAYFQPCSDQLPASICPILIASGSILVCFLVGTGMWGEHLILRRNLVFAYDEIIYFFYFFS